MAYSALVRRLLISCPGDIPDKDLKLIHQAINYWNGVYGESFGAAVIPISWGSHAAAEFGGTPQGLLNKQIVDRCDICIGLFANRLGTPTASSESGTAEEIERLGESARYVGILRSRRPVDASVIDHGQAQRLDAYLVKLRDKALILDYASDDELTQRVDTILAAAIARDKGRADLQIMQASGIMRTAEIWPRVESYEEPVSFGGVTTRTTRNWRLVLTNTGDGPASDVRVKLEAYTTYEDPWRIYTDATGAEPHVEVLAPHSEVKFDLLIMDQTAMQTRCVVTWSDDRGQQQNTATLRLL